MNHRNDREWQSLTPMHPNSFDQGVGAVSCYAPITVMTLRAHGWCCFTSLLKEITPPHVLDQRWHLIWRRPARRFTAKFRFWDARQVEGRTDDVPVISSFTMIIWMDHSGPYTNRSMMKRCGPLWHGPWYRYFYKLYLRDKGLIEYDWDQPMERRSWSQSDTIGRWATRLRNGNWPRLPIYGDAAAMERYNVPELIWRRNIWCNRYLNRGPWYGRIGCLFWLNYADHIIAPCDIGGQQKDDYINETNKFDYQLPTS